MYFVQHISPGGTLHNHRTGVPEDIKVSIPYIKEILKAMKIPIIESDGHEADDIIGTLAKKAEKKDFQVYMVTPDKDFGQLVSDNIFIYRPPYRGRPEEIYGVDEILEKWEIKDVEQVIDILGLMGDSVDNIPGVPGVGAKTAIKLLKEFDSIETLLESTDQLKGKLKEKIEENAEQARISKKLATIVVDLPIAFDEEALIRKEPDKDKLAQLFSELEFRNLGKRLIGDDFAIGKVAEKGQAQMDLFSSGANGGTGEGIEEMATIHNTKHDYKMVTDSEVAALVGLLKKQKRFAFDTETSGLDAMQDMLVGISFSFEAHSGFYVPVPPDFNKASTIIKQFEPVFQDPSIQKIAQNLKFDWLVLKRYGLDIGGQLFDTMIAHFLIEPETRHSLNIMSENYLGYRPEPIETLIGKKGKRQLQMNEVPPEQVSDYACEDADITFRLYDKLKPALSANEVEELFEKVEVPLIEVLTEIEYNGVAVDANFLKKYSGELNEEIIEVRDRIFNLAGTEFNLDSPKQLAEILFVNLKLPYQGRKTSTGQFSTNEEVLSRLAHEHEIAQRLLVYRELSKLKSTYVDALPDMINPETGLIHTTFNQAAAVTGRLASLNPNLQNIPIRTERGREVRKAFKPRGKEYTLLSADYSQIELRIIAALSKDEAMIKAFNDGIDIHSTTASKVYNVPLELVSSEMRRNAKVVNFGIIYGISAFGLSQRLNLPRKEAAQIIESYFNKYPGIKQYMDHSINMAREMGYVKTMLGRKRYLKDINSKNMTVRGFAERNAINSPIQGSAADFIKVAMIRIQDYLKSSNMRSKMILQVHDELVFDIMDGEMDTLKTVIEEEMKSAIKLDVPVEVDIGTGSNWYEAH